MDPYRIVVSEIMLQQTQTYRVEPKYLAFIKKFPNFRPLAKASTAEVLSAWQGLGYNRRALYLKKIAETVVKEYKGKLPSNSVELQKLSGIGPNTAGSIGAFAFNQPVVFIETNIRRVFIHFFFPKKQQVDDRDILKLVADTLDRKNSREWYFALMDYGATLRQAQGKLLKGKFENPNRRSKHYAVQSKFEGSVRQTRGLILKTLLDGPRSLAGLSPEIIADLEREGFVQKVKNKWQLVV